MKWLAGIVLLGMSLAGAQPAPANTFEPTRQDDPPPNGCKSSNCSLREALRAAGNRNGADRVLLGDRTYEMGISDDLGLGIESGDFNLTGPLTVRGAGPRKTKVDANGLDRVFTAGGLSKVKLKALTIKGGDSGANTGHTSIGGGLTAIGGKVVLVGVAIRDNAAQFGGGIWSVAPDLVIRNSTIAGNNAGEGGGMDLRGDVVLAETLIRASTISGNSASKGGGILIDGNPGTGDEPELDVLNSTIAGNMASADGGGVMADNGASAVFSSSTFAYNQANSDDVDLGVGGGLYQHSGAVLAFFNSLVTENEVGQGGSGPQCAGSTTGNGANATTSASCPGGVFLDLPIGPLEDNGGPTRTIKLESGNSAIARTDNCPPRDQRGKPRPDKDCDSGSFERRGP